MYPYTISAKLIFLLFRMICLLRCITTSFHSWRTTSHLPTSPEWRAPVFDDVFQYCTILCQQRRNLIPFGRPALHSKSLHINTIGRLEFWDGNTDSFRGNGMMRIEPSKSVKQHVEVVVL